MMHNRRCRAAQPPDNAHNHHQVAQRRHYQKRSLGNETKMGLDNVVAARLCRWGRHDPVIALRSITGYASCRRCATIEKMY
ncbi:MAG: hypothetical protein LBQ50_05360, partial [Planctomycetaceae bacterium]|nr:hypothetical protein [Planctomycetaceae bacterium]